MLTFWHMPDSTPGPLLLMLLVALVLDCLFGDPPWLYRRIEHPVALLGKLIAWGEQRLNKAGDGRARAFVNGIGLTLLVTLLAFAVGAALSDILGRIPLGWLLEAVLASSLIAYRGLLEHVMAVARGLDRGLDDGRAAVAHIVGRDPQSLDRGGVARAAIESLAENFSDGTVAPAFWFLILGLPGLCAYKAINTLDSMIGHRSARYAWFGKAAARLDDLVNLIPARIAGTLLVFAACVLPRANAAAAWTTMLRDARKHRSPNAGWPEAAMAGALEVALAGPRHYGHDSVNDPWIGKGRAELDAPDIRRALRLYMAAGGIVLLLLFVGALLT